jgi:hypothetical protein
MGKLWSPNAQTSMDEFDYQFEIKKLSPMQYITPLMNTCVNMYLFRPISLPIRLCSLAPFNSHFDCNDELFHIG